MKSIILSFGFFFSCAMSVWAQVPPTSSPNPIDLLVGEWIQKTASIEPAPKNDSWKTQTVINEFSPILDGRGLYRKVRNGASLIEGYFFYDAGSKKLIGMSIDENGYVWQTESMMDDVGQLIGNNGEAISDKTARLETEIEMKDESEIHFVQHFFDGEQEILTVKGFLIRVR